MKRFAVIATTNRGPIDPPELLDERSQWLANIQFALDQDEDQRVRARRRAHYLTERDPPARRCEMEPKPLRGVSGIAQLSWRVG